MTPTESLLFIGGLAAGPVVFLLVLLFVNAHLAPQRPDAVKGMPYECGMPQAGSPWRPVNIRFSTVALLFVIFDIEIVFLFLWAVVFRELGWYGIGVMSVFLGLLIATLFYELKKGALEWASKPN